VAHLGGVIAASYRFFTDFFCAALAPLRVAPTPVAVLQGLFAPADVTATNLWAMLCHTATDDQ